MGGLKENNARSRPSPVQSQVTYIPRELLSLHEEVEVSFDECYTDRQLFVISTSCEPCCRVAITNDGTDKKPIVKVSDEMFQVYCKC